MNPANSVTMTALTLLEESLSINFPNEPRSFMTVTYKNSAYIASINAARSSVQS
jgi:hypothetical protein